MSEKEEGALEHKGGHDYELRAGDESCWITVGAFSVNVRRFGSGVVAKLYVVGEEDGEPVDAAYSHAG
jgi:hypothetical protein